MVLAAVVVAFPLSLGSVARAATPVDAALARSGATTACGTPSAPTATAYLPNITKTLGGPLGWDTPFYVQNAGPVQTTVEATFYRFSDGAPVACRKTSGGAWQPCEPREGHRPWQRSARTRPLVPWGFVE